MDFWPGFHDFWANLPAEQRINFVIAVGTILAAIVAAVSAIFAAISVWVTRRAVEDAARAFRAQTFHSIVEYEHQVQFSLCMDTVRNLKGKLPSDEERKNVLVVVNFLNHVAHMIRHRYVAATHVFLLYSPSIRACRGNLLQPGQWIAQEREKDSSYYLHFAKLCEEETERLIWACQADKIRWTADKPCEE